MSPQKAHPGVSLPALGAHPIAAAPTSTAAFVGWAPQGSTAAAVLVSSAQEYATLFGGLTRNNGGPNYLGYAVGQFFDNGGTQAYIVRVVWDGTLATPVSPAPAVAATASVTAGGSLGLFAGNPGQWANAVWIRVILPPGDPAAFTVQVLDPSGLVLENFAGLSVEPANPAYVVTTINAGSRYVTFVDPSRPGAAIAPPAAPSATASGGVALAGGADGEVLLPAGNGDFERALGANPLATHGIHLLDNVEGLGLLCVPGETDAATIANLQAYSVSRRAFYLVDCPQAATIAGLSATGPAGTGPAVGLTGANASNSAYYFPWVLAPDPLANGAPTLFPPSGFVAGIYAATDASRGVWKAPAGLEASLEGALGLAANPTDAETVALGALAVNCLRNLPVYNSIVWGARTLQGADGAGSQWKYVPVRRLALYVESSLQQGTQWVVFEPNAPPLWGQIRLGVGAFLQGLFLQGALQGTTPQQAYFVKCDAENNPPSSVAQGIVNINVGFAPLFPAEFLVIQIQQWSGHG
jgi:phage tail sheath protein FI